MIATCNECVKEGVEPFQVPWGDHIGPALMEEHFRDKHPEIELKK